MDTPSNPEPLNAPAGPNAAPGGPVSGAPPGYGAPTPAIPQNAAADHADGVGSGEDPPLHVSGDHRRATPEEVAASPQPPSTPADRLRQWRWKQGQSGRTGHKGPNREARLLKDLRALAGTKVKDMRFAVEIALRLNMSPDEIASEDFTLSKLLVMSGFVHAIRGNAAYFSEIAKRVDANASMIDDPDEAYEAATPDDERIRAVALYRRIINSEDATIQQRMDAQREMNTLLGLATSDSRSAQDKAKIVLDTINEIERF
jgi:hypothetical protein